MMFFGIAVSGALGAMSRYFIAQRMPWSRTGNFPVATLFVNVIGSALLGMLYSLYLQNIVSVLIWQLLGVGVLGAFTTFSTFSYELFLLLEQRRRTAAISYVAATVGLGVLAAAVGYLLCK